MRQELKSYLFAKHYIVNDYESRSNPFETLYSLANIFDIRITNGQELAHSEMVGFVAQELGRFVAPAFYRGFPQTARELSFDQLLFDQLLHYTVTYGFDDFSEPGHSVFEKDFERLAFEEITDDVKEFEIISEEKAIQMLFEMASDMLQNSRPLNDEQFHVLFILVDAYGYPVEKCASKDTAVRLLVNTGNCDYARFLSLPDVIKVVDYIQYTHYYSKDLTYLHFTNKDRKLITSLLDLFLQNDKSNVTLCFEKKKIWCGLLHHIHYRPKTEFGKCFVNSMRTKGNLSTYSAFEKCLSQGNIKGAVDVLIKEKGNNALMRHLVYLLSRCETDDDIDHILDRMSADNVIILLQMLMMFSGKSVGARDFVFVSHNKLCVHIETEEEVESRKSRLSDEVAQKAKQRIQDMLKKKLKGTVGSVYIHQDMKKMALPLQENASMGGFGVLAKGSKLPIDLSKKVRAFTYWEKVNDIDMSAIGLCDDGTQEEFSWRTMFAEQSSAITFSGDQTSGYNGGSEFFDIDTTLFKKKNPQIRYLVFCNNVFPAGQFSKCFCKAGYMLRDICDSGEIFEPKTVQTSFAVNCNSSYACLFAIDLRNNELIWLNLAMDYNSNVAGDNLLGFLKRYFDTTDIISVADFFEMLSTDVVNDPSTADIIVSDQPVAVRDGAELIHSYDFEKIAKYFM